MSMSTSEGMSANDALVVIQRQGDQATITLNRPRVLNALSRATAQELKQAADEVAADQSVRLVVLTGEGRAFCVGADLKERLSMTADEMTAHTELILAAADAIAAIPAPTIAAIRGHCLAGGAEIALGCDLRFAEEGATFGFPEVKRGIFPGAGAVVRLPRLIGPARASDLIFSGRTIDAGEAYRLGLVDRLVPAGGLEAEVERFTHEVQVNAPLAVRAAKTAIQRGLDLPLAEAMTASIALRRPLDDTEDYQEGLRAFAERRDPEFKGA